MTKAERSFCLTTLLKKSAENITRSILNNNRLTIMKAPRDPGKNAATTALITPKRGTQGINGFISIVIKRSFGSSRVRVAIIPGTLQPNPETKEKNDFPCNYSSAL